MLANPVAEFALVCKGLLVGTGMVGAAERWAESARVPVRVRELLSKSVSGATSSDAGWAGDLAGFGTLVGAFSDSIKTESVFFRLLDSNSLVRAPMRVPLGVIVAGVAAALVDEAAAKPVVKMTVGNIVLQPMKVGALMVMTRRLAADISGEGQSLFTRELRGACASAVDDAFLAGLAGDSDATVIQSSGDDVVDAMADLRAALTAINYGSVGRASLAWIVADDVAKRASTLWDGGNPFPNMSPTGGEMCNLPALVSQAVPDGQIYLVDASGIAANSASISVRTSQAADIQMDAVPTGDASTPTASQLTSLWQTDSVALLAEVSFSFSMLRDGVVAVVENVGWGGESTL